MFVVAVFTTVRRVEAPKAWPWATLAMLAGLLPVVLVILLTRTVPPTGIALVPVVGILAGNTMNGHTLACRRAFAALREEKGQYEAALSLGLTRAQAIDEVMHRRVPEALIPGLDQVRTAGVVTLPGAFIGVLLGGGSPAQAATAQVLVLIGDHGRADDDGRAWPSGSSARPGCCPTTSRPRCSPDRVARAELGTGTFRFAPLTFRCEGEGSGIGRESWGQRRGLAKSTAPGGVCSPVTSR